MVAEKLRFYVINLYIVIEIIVLQQSDLEFNRKYMFYMRLIESLYFIFVYLYEYLLHRTGKYYIGICACACFITYYYITVIVTYYRTIYRIAGEFFIKFRSVTYNNYIIRLLMIKSR